MNAEKNEKEFFLSVETAGNAVGIPKNNMRHYAKKYKRGKKISGQWRFRIEDLTFFEELKKKGPGRPKN